MKRDSLAFAISGTLFGLIVGWIIGSQQAAPPPGAAPAPVAAAAPASNAPSAPEQPAAFDAARATTLERQAAAEPANVQARIELGDVYFDGQRYAQAIPWYEAALKLEPRNVNASTDLAIAYYYSNQVDRALEQFDKSLAIDPKHLKTLLNQGIVKAWGKSDLTGAAEAWQKLVAIAPDSEEGRRAKLGLDGINAAHQNGGGSAAGGQ
ncbi:MAG: tetratricopeptide repeat protein [Vicinamibacterales bacterium]